MSASVWIVVKETYKSLHNLKVIPENRYSSRLLLSERNLLTLDQVELYYRTVLNTFV